MTMKMTAAPIIRAFGFRRVLIGNAVISSAFIMTYSLFTPATPHWLILVGLLAGGFFRSLEFTSINTLAYADIPAELMSRATSFQSMAQQLSISIGVGSGALLLHVMMLLRGGGELATTDFTAAFLAVGMISVSSVLFFVGLSREAGAEVSGHGARARAPAERRAPGD